VYKAQHKKTGFVVAIKCIKFDPTGDLERKVRKEIEVLKLARGKNIVSYFGNGMRKNQIWVSSYLSFSSPPLFFVLALITRRGHK